MSREQPLLLEDELLVELVKGGIDVERLRQAVGRPALGKLLDHLFGGRHGFPPRELRRS